MCPPGMLVHLTCGVKVGGVARSPLWFGGSRDLLASSGGDSYPIRVERPHTAQSTSPLRRAHAHALQSPSGWL